MERELARKLKERAQRAHRALLKEKETYGFINDGAGKRYRIGVFYLLSGETAKALDYYAWFASEFPDDVQEPIFDLYWALALYRAGDLPKALLRLQAAMLSNIYMLPAIFGEPVETHEIWHSSSHAAPDYLLNIEEYLEEPTDEEREWMRRAYHSESFSRLRARYIETYGALLHEREVGKRSRILNDWLRYVRESHDSSAGGRR